VREDDATRKRRRVRLVQRYLLNPPIKLLVWAGLVPGHALVETVGRRSGRRRRTVVGMHVEGDVGWVVAEQGRHAGYVNNLHARPDVRVRIHRRWRAARAQIVDDDPDARLESFGRPRHADAVRRFGTDLTTVRFDLGSVSTTAPRSPSVPPSWFVHLAWRAHRGLHRLSGGRFLWTPLNKRGWGALRLTTVGRRSGRDRSVIIGYLEDGPNLVALAMNGWEPGHPAWWLNLEVHPDAVVRLARQTPRPVRGQAATSEERDRLWRLWVAVEPELDAYAARRPTETPVVVLEPRDGTA
jgi:deazaflavin-dependent oxidoreductase (nitroreductase family)